MSFLGELKRRNVIKVGAAYAIVAWLLIQIGVTVFPVLKLPEWSAALLIVFLILCFPVALVLAWAYELTPTGIRQTTDVPPAESITHATGQRLNLAVIGLLGVALVYVALDAYVFTGATDPSPPRVSDARRPAVSAATPSGARVSRVSINPSPREQWVISPHDPDFAISPDGERIAYIGRRDGINHLVIRSLDEFEGRSLGSFGGVIRYPFFSPDGQWVGFVDGNALKKANVRDGTAVTVTVLPAYMSGASWGTDGTIIFGTLNNGLFSVPASGGRAEPFGAIPAGSSARWPYLLPGDDAVLFSAVGRGGAEVRVRSRSDGGEKIVVDDALFPHYTSSGHLLYVSDGVLWAAAFDLGRLELASSPVPIVDGVMIKGPRQTGLGSANVGVADNGTLVYRAAGREGSGTSTLVWVDRAGREEPLAFEPRVYGRLQLTRDGARVAIEVTDANLTNTDIWVGNVAGSTLQPLTFEPSTDEYPVWTADGTHVAFFSTRDGGGLFVRAADGSGSAVRLLPASVQGRPWFAFPDGSGVVFSGILDGRAAGRFYRVGVDGNGDYNELDLLAGPVAAISAEGRWLAYSSEKTGNFEIYVQPYPNPELTEWRITTNGGRDPVWSHDGTELYFQNDTTVYAAQIATEPGFAASPPQALFDGPYIDSLGRWYDVAPDGRFLMVKPGWLSAAEDTPLFVVLNWFEELSQAVGRAQ